MRIDPSDAAPANGWRLRPAHGWLIAGVGVVALGVAWYNLARFGSPFGFGYAHIPSGDSGLITDEPWFSEGLMSSTYIPRHLRLVVVGVMVHAYAIWVVNVLDFVA